MLARFDRDLRHVFINSAGARAMGVSSETILGRAPHDLHMPAELCDQLEAHYAERDSGEQQSVAVTFDGPQGRRHFATLVVPERGATGEVDTLLAVSRDDTARRNAEDALRMADKRKDEFLAMLAHELRNPLAPIRNASELLMRTVDAEPHMRALADVVKRQTAHLTRLVDDLLDVSRITQGRIELQCRPIQVAAIVAQALESVDNVIPAERSALIRVRATASCVSLSATMASASRQTSFPMSSSFSCKVHAPWIVPKGV